MKKFILGAVSGLALMAAAPALADSQMHSYQIVLQYDDGGEAFGFLTWNPNIVQNGVQGGWQQMTMVTTTTPHQPGMSYSVEYPTLNACYRPVPQICLADVPPDNTIAEGQSYPTAAGYGQLQIALGAFDPNGPARQTIDVRNTLEYFWAVVPAQNAIRHPVTAYMQRIN